MEETIKKRKVGGLKVVEEGACVASSFPSAATPLGGITASLARQRINLSFLAYVAGNARQESNLALCTELQAGASSHSLVQTDWQRGLLQLFSGTCIVSLYPHDQKAEITGHFLRSLARARVILHGLGSSPAAISGVMSIGSRDRAIQQLFEQFQFPAYQSPAEFYAAQLPPAELVRAVVAAYQEKVIKIYCLVQEVGLELWELHLPSVQALEDFGVALVAIGEKGIRLPFLVALPAPNKNALRICFGLGANPPGGDQAKEIARILNFHLPGCGAQRYLPAAAIFVHGPHFGDRYGIAHTLVDALERAQVTPLALSCTVSSLSVIIKQAELAPAVAILEKTFEVPRGQPVPCRGRNKQ